MIARELVKSLSSIDIGTGGEHLKHIDKDTIYVAMTKMTGDISSGTITGHALNTSITGNVKTGTISGGLNTKEITGNIISEIDGTINQKEQ